MSRIKVKGLLSDPATEVPLSQRTETTGLGDLQSINYGVRFYIMMKLDVMQYFLATNGRITIGNQQLDRVPAPS